MIAIHVSCCLFSFFFQYSFEKYYSSSNLHTHITLQVSVILKLLLYYAPYNELLEEFKALLIVHTETIATR